MRSSSDGCEGGAKVFDIETVASPFDTHKEEAGFVILMLFGVDDIGPMFIGHAGNAPQGLCDPGS
jgi:hypothetical protein